MKNRHEKGPCTGIPVSMREILSITKASKVEICMDQHQPYYVISLKFKDTRGVQVYHGVLDSRSELIFKLNKVKRGFSDSQEKHTL